MVKVFKSVIFHVTEAVVITKTSGTYSLLLLMVFRLCRGGELLDRILSRYMCPLNFSLQRKLFDLFMDLLRTWIWLVFSRGGKYSEEDAKTVVVQILSVVAFCHLQGVVHRDLKPEVIDSYLPCIMTIIFVF